MKKLNLYFLLAAVLPLLTSCEVIGGIFKAGVAGGVIITVIIVGLIVWLITRGRGKGNP